MKNVGAILLVVATAGCAGSSGDLAALRPSIGQVACNATNGMYRGAIVDVAMYSAAGQAPTPVYVVERDGRRSNAPPANTVVVPDRCPDGQPLAPAPPTVPAAAAPKVASDLARVNAEFSRRLDAFQGELRSLQASRGVIIAIWTSKRCDMAEAEVIDLLLSLVGGHPGRITLDVRGERTCDGSARTFRITGDQFEQYRAGSISDLEVLRGLR